ncbi:MAG TPA: hypothetical protein VG604_04175 [Candidatus Saccharimonadales bacterium]|nr:hypothetical protein [Candidatus Saccharimonadales bacterium]
MTRFLSEALTAPEPLFRNQLGQLEAANGHPSHDIRLSAEVKRAAQDKLRQLGLDPFDTTDAELYHALQQRVAADDAQLTKKLRTLAALNISAEGDVVDGMVHALQQLPDNQRTFALKATALRKLIKQLPPKKAIKRLGYRSLDSFLKHETPVSMITAAWLAEDERWQRKFREQYRKLAASDFEDRQLTITKADFRRGADFAESVVAQAKHNVLSFKELGALVILPFPSETPAGAVTVSLGLAVHELNELRAASTYLKLNQVRPDFGNVVQATIADKAELGASLLDQPISWKLIQRYYTHLQERFQESLFGPHVQLEDMVWRPIEHTLAAIEPSLAFWVNSAHLASWHGIKPVSLNLLDAATNYCNSLPFEQRIVHYFQRSLWHELLLRYLQAETVEQTVLAELQPELATETVSA